MERFDLTLYKDSKQYFVFFDIYIKQLSINKETFLSKIGITPSSYRKCRKGGLNIGPKIIEQLSTHFNLIVPKNGFIDDLTKFLDKIYYNMYYKIYTSYEDDLKQIDELIKKNYIIFPILDLFKLFLITSSNIDISTIKKECAELYLKVLKYKTFFNESIYEIFELVYLIFEDEIPEDSWIKNYNNASAYYILAARCSINKRYIECLFFASKSKELLQKDGNISRLLALNHTIMNCLINVGNFEECYDLSSRQLLILQSIEKFDGQQLRAANKFISLSLLGLKRYDKLIERLEKKESLNLTELTCLLIAKYNVNKNEYNKCFDDLEIDSYDDKKATFLKNINQYLKHPSRSQLIKLEKDNLVEYIIKILKIS